MKDLQPQQSFYKERRHVSYPLQSKTAEILRHRLPSIHLYFCHYLPPFSLLIRSILSVVHVGRLFKKLFFWCIIHWNNSRTTNSQNLGCKRIGTRPTGKWYIFPAIVRKNVWHQLSNFWYPQGRFDTRRGKELKLERTKSTEQVASARSKIDAKILPRPLSLLTRSSSTSLFSHVFEAYCIHG